jgi:hypothetical protein
MGDVVVLHMKLIFYYNSRVEPFRRVLDEIFSLLRKCEEKRIECKIIDTKDMGDPEINDIYLNACTPSVFKKYAIRKIFGTNRNSGVFFAKQVPALLVYEDNQIVPSDVYPHEKGKQEIEIIEFLKNLLAEGITHPPS